MANLSTSLKELIAERMNVPINEVTDTAELSLHQSDRSFLTNDLFQRFDINITDEDTKLFITTEDIFRFVETKLWWYSL